MQNEKVFYKTSNLNLATTLYTIGFPINGIYTSKESEIMEFYFEQSPKLEKAVDDFFGRRLKVEPYTLLINRREIISRIKNEQTNTQE